MTSSTLGRAKGKSVTGRKRNELKRRRKEVEVSAVTGELVSSRRRSRGAAETFLSEFSLFLHFERKGAVYSNSVRRKGAFHPAF